MSTRSRLMWTVGMLLIVSAAYAMGVRHPDNDVLFALFAVAIGGILIGAA